MTDIKYTKSQETAIKERDKNIIVSAAAGSGKTRVLVDRVLDLIIKDHVNIDQMIIVTFTNKASIEMKDRIRSNLEDRLRNDPSSKFLKDQLKLLKHAHIQTLHAFASDMLREYFYFLDDLSPSFSLISDNTTVILKEEAIDEVFDEEYKKGRESFHNFIHNFATSRNDRQAKDAILKTYNEIEAKVNPIAWLDEKTSSPFDINYFKDNIFDKLNEVLDKVRANKQIGLDNDLRDKYIEMLDDDFAIINQAYKLADSNWDDFIAYVYKIKFKTMVRARADEKDIQPTIKANRDLYKKDMKDIGSLILNTNSDIIKEFNDKEMAVLEEVNFLTKRFMAKYKAKKKDKSYLDFNDMEEDFIGLLEIEEARTILKDRFKYIFFDEYQDSNDIQNYIIEKLKADDNLFFVGDVKQSIYGFRNAKPKLFLDKLDSYENPSNDKSIRINLNENFRTDKDILNFDNYIFDRLMTKKSSGIDYKDGGHRLNATKEFESDNKKVEIDVLDPSIREENHIVEVIKKVISEGYEYRDIAILLRSGAKSYIYEEAFKKADIPYFNDISKVSFGAVEVTFFINILNYIANPKDDITLLSVLQSEIYKFTEDDIASIRLNTNKISFVEAFNSYDIDDKLSVKINDFKTEMSDYNYQLSLMNLYEFANYVFEKSGYYEFLMARDRANDRIENVEAFIDLMSDYEKNNDNGLYGFLSYVENLSLYQTDNINTARDLSESENLVRIMTIHKSKGLEFPVVILADAAKRFNNRHLSQNVVYDDELGIGINVADYANKVKLSSLKRDLITEKITIENKREEMRVLYVALTRPINKLIVVGNRNLNTVGKLYGRDDYLNMSTYLDWILASLSLDKISQDVFESDYETDDFNGEVTIEVINSEKEYKISKDKDISQILNSNEYNEKLYDKFVDLYTKPYSYEDDTRESIKKSVTEITKNFNPEDDGYELPVYNRINDISDYRKPSFITDVREYKAIDRGTIIHKVFQSLPYQNYDKKKLARALDRLIIENKVKKDELKVVEEDKILAYFNNPHITNLYQNATSIRREESFLMKYEDYYVNGQIDLIFESDNQIVLLDFKTDAKKREGFYNDQLWVYKMAIEEALGKKVTKSLIYWYNFGEIEEVN